MIFFKTKDDKAQFDKNGLICNLSNGKQNTKNIRSIKEQV